MNKIKSIKIHFVPNFTGVAMLWLITQDTQCTIYLVSLSNCSNNISSVQFYQINDSFEAFLAFIRRRLT